MSVIYYTNNVGSTTNSTGQNDFNLIALSGYTSFSSYDGEYIPYYVRQDNDVNNWEYGLGLVTGTTLIRSIIYNSSNNNAKVNFSSGSKTIYSTINAERINRGGYNYSGVNSNFSIRPFQTVFAVTALSQITGSLPPSSGNENLVLGFRLTNSSTNNLVIKASGSDTIDGLATTTLTPSEKYLSLIGDGVSGWLLLNRSTEIVGSGLPSGNIGNVQFKGTATSMSGTNDFSWNTANKLLLLGGSGTGTANIQLPASSGYNTRFNISGYDSDFEVKGTGSNRVYYDASAGRLGINTAGLPSTILHVVGSCANETMRIESSTACNTGVALTLYHNPPNGVPPGAYPATINLAGRNGNGQQVNYARVSSRVLGSGINATSGELMIDVDYTGVTTNVFSIHPFRTVIGLNSSGNSSTNVVIGNNSTDVGGSNILLGHNSRISLSSSTGNTILGHSNSSFGVGNFMGGVSNYVSGNANTILGNSSSGVGSGLLSLSNNRLNGTGLVILGTNTTVTGVSSVVVGNNNLFARNVSGVVVVGNSNSISSTGDISFGNNNTIDGNNNTVIGRSSVITGSNNIVFGSGNISSGNSNVLFGQNISFTGSSGIVIGRDINTSVNSGIVFGVGSLDVLLTSGELIINNDRNSFGLSVYGSSVGSGLFVKNNNVGINKSGSYPLDVNGIIRSSGLDIGGPVKLSGLSGLSNTYFTTGDVITVFNTGNNQLAYVSATGFFDKFNNVILPISIGGTASSTASGARSNLGLIINSDVQAYHPNLSGIANGTYIGSTGITILGTIVSGSWSGSIIDISKGGTNSTSASGARSNLGLAINSDVQAYHPNLSGIASGTYVGSTGIQTVGTLASGTWNATNIAVNKGGTGADLTVNSGNTSGSLLFYETSGSSHLFNKDSKLKWINSSGLLAIGYTGSIPSQLSSTSLSVTGLVRLQTVSAGTYGTALGIDASGYVGQHSSSIRFKENIIPYSKSLSEIEKLNPVYFNYIGYPNTVAGLIAEEVAGSGFEEFINRDMDSLPHSISYSSMIVLLINAIKELKQRIEVLENK